MTVTPATTTRPLIRDVRAARGRRRVFEAGWQTTSTTLRAPTIIAKDAEQRRWLAQDISALVPSAR